MSREQRYECRVCKRAFTPRQGSSGLVCALCEAHGRQSPTARRAGPMITDEGAIFELEPEAPRPRAAPAAKPLDNCQRCRAEMPAEAVICVECGYDRRSGAVTKGKVRGAPPASGPRCPHCKYDLAGLKGTICPECGKPVSGSARVRQTREEATRELVRRIYVRSAVMSAIGVGISAAVLGSVLGNQGVMLAVVAWAITVVLAFIVSWICSLTWLGFDSAAHITLVQLAAVLALTQAASDLVGLLPVLIFVWPLAFSVLVCAALLWEIMEMDVADAFICAILFVPVRIGAMFAAVSVTNALG